MDEWLQSLVPWGTEVIVWAQSHSGRLLDAVWQVFTTLGYEEFYLLLFPLVYWCIHKQIGAAVAYVAMLSAWSNNALKMLFNTPRPSDPRIEMRAPRAETSPSFPSGHAQNAVANWGYLALRCGGVVPWIAAAVLILGIGASRVFLGVHYPQDVIGGWLIGFVVVGLFALGAPPVGRWLAGQTALLKAAAAVGLPVLLIFLHPAEPEGLYPAEGAITPMSALVGFGIGLIMEGATVCFRVDGRLAQRALRLLVGLAVLGVLYLAPSQLIPDGLPYGWEAVLRFVRYALLGWAGAFLCPWLFVRLRLASRQA